MYIKELMRWFSINLFQLTTGGVRLGPRLSLGGLRVCVIEHEMQVIKTFLNKGILFCSKFFDAQCDLSNQDHNTANDKEVRTTLFSFHAN